MKYMKFYEKYNIEYAACLKNKFPYWLNVK